MSISISYFYPCSSGYLQWRVLLPRSASRTIRPVISLSALLSMFLNFLILSCWQRWQRWLLDALKQCLWHVVRTGIPTTLSVIIDNAVRILSHWLLERKESQRTLHFIRYFGCFIKVFTLACEIFIVALLSLGYCSLSVSLWCAVLTVSFLVWYMPFGVTLLYLSCYGWLKILNHSDLS